MASAWHLMQAKSLKRGLLGDAADATCNAASGATRLRDRADRTGSFPVDAGFFTGATFLVIVVGTPAPRGNVCRLGSAGVSAT